MIINGRRDISPSKLRAEEDAYDEECLQFERFGNYEERIGPSLAVNRCAVAPVDRTEIVGTLRERLAKNHPNKYRLEESGDLTRL
jgi:hypothetical protein